MPRQRLSLGRLRGFPKTAAQIRTIAATTSTVVRVVLDEPIFILTGGLADALYPSANRPNVGCRDRNGFYRCPKKKSSLAKPEHDGNWSISPVRKISEAEVQLRRFFESKIAPRRRAPDRLPGQSRSCGGCEPGEFRDANANRGRPSLLQIWQL